MHSSLNTAATASADKRRVDTAKGRVVVRARNQRRLALADEASARIGTTLDITRTAQELLDVAIPRLADAGAVDLLATVIDGDRRPHNQELRLHRAALRWPADSPLPGYLPPAWLETDPAKLIHQHLAPGLPVYRPAFGAMTAEQITQIASGAGLNLLLAAHAAGAQTT